MTDIGTRRQGREAALQMLYLTDLGGRLPEEFPPHAWSSEPLPSKTRAFAEHLVNGVLTNQESIDVLIRKYAANWEMSRMAAIDRSILRLASFEILYETETPANVAINEALEIAKKYSTADSSKFVNGILDKVKLERRI